MLIAADSNVATPRYLYDFCRSAIGQHALLANTSQTGVPAIARPTSSIRSIRCVVPPIQVLRAFDSLVDAIYWRRESAGEESRTLAALRDTLLPKLVSGELRIRDTENFAEAAI
jgi:type I restriction enzyme, S subunit